MSPDHVLSSSLNPGQAAEGHLCLQLLELLAVPGAAASDTVGAADVATLQYEACVTLIDVIALCNARRADDVPALEALAVDVTDDTADALWGCANALLDAKAECCQEIDSLREGLESGGIAGPAPHSGRSQCSRSLLSPTSRSLFRQSWYNESKKTCISSSRLALCVVLLAVPVPAAAP